MQSLYELSAPSLAIRQAITALCELDPDFLAIEAKAGPLTILTLPPSFAAMVRIVVGQQLATKAAKAIYFRLLDTVVLEPEPFLLASDEVLQSAGLSRAKIKCCRGIAEAITSGTLDLAQCAQQPEAQVFTSLTAIPGIGPWTAELFMLFALERSDIFPAGDLAIRRGYAHLKQQGEPLDTKQLIRTVEPLRPYRSAATHLLWHYYRHLTGFAGQAV